MVNELQQLVKQISIYGMSNNMIHHKYHQLVQLIQKVVQSEIIVLSMESTYKYKSNSNNSWTSYKRMGFKINEVRIILSQ